MTSGGNRAQAIFEEAVDLSTGDRTAFIDEACGEDETLKQTVLTLLKYASDDDDDIADGTDRAKTPDELVGSTIGNYTLRSVLGEGGFGVVYLADQTAPVKRRVAVKVIKLGMDTKAVIARFEAERQALALMDHANVARIFDGGTTDSGRPYFVMELVKGVSITEFCDTNRLKIRDRIDLFRMACDAIQHAHTKGVIHRDIKPNNILVFYEEGKPSVKVIDFGIAKALDRQLTEQTVFTESGQFVGTPEYMSPEQAQMTALDVDTRTDVYALGVLLYELLTGQLPFDAKTLRAAALGEIQRIIREETPAKPSTRCSSMVSSASEEASAIAQARQVDLSALPRRLRGDLDWIVMQCLEKDRSRRYDTASALAADLGRHLANEPVDAGAPSAAYRFKKFAKRKSGLLAACALIALALIGGIAASSYFAIEANARAKEAQAFSQAATDSRDEAIKAKDQAEQREQEVTILNSRLTTLISFTSNGLVREGNQIKDNKGFDLRRIKSWIDEAARVAQAELYQTGKLEEADIRTFIGSLYRKFGFYPEAFNQFKIALEIRKNVLGDQDIDTLWQATLLISLSNKLETGGMSVTEYSRYYKMVLDNLDRVIDARTERSRELLTMCLGEVLVKMPWFFDVLVPRAIQSVQSANVGYNVNLGYMLIGRGARNGQLGNRKAQLDDYQAGLVQLRASLGERNRETLAMRWRLGECLITNGDLRQGSEQINIAYQGFLSTRGASFWQTNLTGRRLASIHIEREQFEEAEEYLLVPFAACLDELGIEDERTQGSVSDLAQLYTVWGRPQEAQKYRAMLPDLGPTAEEPTDEQPPDR